MILAKGNMLLLDKQTDKFISMKRLIIPFEEAGIKDVALVGGKNASLGEMYANLAPMGINIPNGFATTADAYWEFVNSNHLKEPLSEALASLDIQNFSNLHDTGLRCRELMMSGSLPEALKKEIKEAYSKLVIKYGKDISLAVRSSATVNSIQRLTCTYHFLRVAHK